MKTRRRSSRFNEGPATLAKSAIGPRAETVFTSDSRSLTQAAPVFDILQNARTVGRFGLTSESGRIEVQSGCMPYIVSTVAATSVEAKVRDFSFRVASRYTERVRVNSPYFCPAAYAPCYGTPGVDQYYFRDEIRTPVTEYGAEFDTEYNHQQGIALREGESLRFRSLGSYYRGALTSCTFSFKLHFFERRNNSRIRIFGAVGAASPALMATLTAESQVISGLSSRTVTVSVPASALTQWITITAEFE